VQKEIEEAILGLGIVIPIRFGKRHILDLNIHSNFPGSNLTPVARCCDNCRMLLRCD
jgi:hypothetical protein